MIDLWCSPSLHILADPNGDPFIITPDMCDEPQIRRRRKRISIYPDICHQLTEQSYHAMEDISAKKRVSSNKGYDEDEEVIQTDMRRRRRNITRQGTKVSSYLQLHKGDYE